MMKSKKIVSFALAVFMITLSFSTVFADETTESTPFTDVAEDAWYYGVVKEAYERGLIEGKTETLFAPQDDVTGGEFIVMTLRADAGAVSETGELVSIDEAVEQAERNGLISDEDAWTFEADTPLTREQMMIILYRYMSYKGVSMTESADLTQFADGGDVSDYAEEAANGLAALGIIEGDGVNLRPQDPITRAEASAVLIRTLEYIESSGEESGGGETPPDMPPGGFGGSQEVTQGTSANTISEDGVYSGETYTSTGDDENALRIVGAEVTLEDITVDKSAGATSNTENGDFYGQNAALLATDGANVTITGADVSSSAQNGNGVFSYGEGTTVTISDSTITTTEDNSGGIHTTGGGTMYAYDLDVTTGGSSAAAIRSDRGGGTVVVDGGSYTSNGFNSPAIYSTADITVSNAELTATNSEALVIEGKNSITLNDCSVYGNMSDTQGTSSDENVHNVMIYQSMSGDADVGTSEFSMTGGTLTGNNGDMIYVTNTHSIINLSGVTIENNDDEAYLMRICGNTATRGWGQAGANGAQVEFTADDQILDGDIIVDTISNLEMTLTNNSEFTGTINIVENEQGGEAVSDNAVVTINEGSTWTLTGDCTITSLENNGTIDYNGYTITLADGTVLG